MNIFNKPYKTKSEKESTIKTIIENICQKADTKILIDPSQNNIFIKDEEKHLDVVILSNSLILTNTVFSLRESFNIGFIDLLKDIALKRASSDRQEMLDEILSRKNNLLNKFNT